MGMLFKYFFKVIFTVVQNAKKSDKKEKNEKFFRPIEVSMPEDTTPKFNVGSESSSNRLVKKIKPVLLDTRKIILQGIGNKAFKRLIQTVLILQQSVNKDFMDVKLTTETIKENVASSLDDLLNGITCEHRTEETTSLTILQAELCLNT